MLCFKLHLCLWKNSYLVFQVFSFAIGGLIECIVHMQLGPKMTTIWWEKELLNSVVRNYFDFFVFFRKKLCHINLNVLFIEECTTVFLFFCDIAVQ